MPLEETVDLLRSPIPIASRMETLCGVSCSLGNGNQIRSMPLNGGIDLGKNRKPAVYRKTPLVSMMCPIPTDTCIRASLSNRRFGKEMTRTGSEASPMY